MDKWYINFFKGIALQYWKNALPEKHARAEADFLEKSFNLKKGSRILDVLSGYGRHSLILGEKGYAVTAVDISGEYTRYLEAASFNRKLPIKAVKGDILKINPGRNYDGAFCLGNSFSYFDEEGMAVFIGRIAKSLKAGARFIANTGMAAECILPNFYSNENLAAGKIALQLSHVYLPARGCIETRYVFTAGNKKEERVSRHYVYSLYDLSRMLEEKRLRIENLYSSLSGGKYRFGDPQVYIVTRKY